MSKGELLEKHRDDEELEQKVKEQQMQAEYQSHLREQYFQERCARRRTTRTRRWRRGQTTLDEVVRTRRTSKAARRRRRWRRWRRRT